MVVLPEKEEDSGGDVLGVRWIALLEVVHASGFGVLENVDESVDGAFASSLCGPVEDGDPEDGPAGVSQAALHLPLSLQLESPIFVEGIGLGVFGVGRLCAVEDVVGAKVKEEWIDDGRVAKEEGEQGGSSGVESGGAIGVGADGVRSALCGAVDDQVWLKGVEGRLNFVRLTEIDATKIVAAATETPTFHRP